MSDIRKYINLCELKPSHAKHLVKQENWTPIALQNWLKANKYKEIGKGGYSVVYANPKSNIIIKLSHDYDPGYQWFVDYCKQNKGNPHLPKIGTIKKYEWKTTFHTSMFVLFSEKLKPLTSSIPGLQYWSKTNLYNYRDVTTEEKQEAWIFQQNNLLFCQTLLDIKNKIPSNLYLDVFGHSDESNIMLRGDTLVITDPLSN